MGNCFGLIKDIDSCTQEDYDRIIITYSWRFEEVKSYCKTKLKLDTLYDWNGLPFIRLNTPFIEKCIKYLEINFPYNITEKNGQFIIRFYHNRQSNKANSIVPYNEAIETAGNLGFSYI
jgi:hypothetical protein